MEQVGSKLDYVIFILGWRIPLKRLPYLEV